MDVKVFAGLDQQSSRALVEGTTIQDVISEKERETFGLTDSMLKDAVAKYHGKAPNDAYLSSPTPWGDLYKTYGWQQVTRVLEPTSAQILLVQSKPAILAKAKFENTSSQPATYNISLTETVEETSSYSWEVGGELTLSHTFGVEFYVVENTYQSYSQKWGIGGQSTTARTVGSSAGVSVTLDGGKSVEATLEVHRGAITAKIMYNAFLVGDVAVNYNPRFKDHHFWGLPVNEVMAAANIANSVKSAQELTFEYHANVLIRVVDIKGKELPKIFLIANKSGR